MRFASQARGWQRGGGGIRKLVKEEGQERFSGKECEGISAEDGCYDIGGSREED